MNNSFHSEGSTLIFMVEGIGILKGYKWVEFVKKSISKLVTVFTISGYSIESTPSPQFPRRRGKCFKLECYIFQQFQ